MPNFKLTVSDTKGKSITKELKDNEGNPFVGHKIGDEMDASTVGLQGKIVIKGGSDKSGVPMRTDIHGPTKKYVLLTKGVGLKADKGQRFRKLMRGNSISEEIYQINCRYDGQLPVEQKEEAQEGSEQKEEQKKE